MIQVNKIVPQTVEFFAPDETSLGWLNQYEFNDLRVQIMQSQVEGYTFEFENEIFDIDKDGRLPLWPKGFFEVIDEQLRKLIGF